MIMQELNFFKMKENKEIGLNETERLFTRD